MTSSIFLVSLLFLGISMLVSGVLKSKFSAYAGVPLSNGMTGSEIARKILQDN